MNQLAETFDVVDSDDNVVESDLGTETASFMAQIRADRERRSFYLVPAGVSITDVMPLEVRPS